MSCILWLLDWNSINHHKYYFVRRKETEKKKDPHLSSVRKWVSLSVWGWGETAGWRMPTTSNSFSRCFPFFLCRDNDDKDRVNIVKILTVKEGFTVHNTRRWTLLRTCYHGIGRSIPETVWIHRWAAKALHRSPGWGSCVSYDNPTPK